MMILKKIVIIFLTLGIGFILPGLAGEIHKAAKDGDFATVKQLLEKDPKLLNAGNRLEQTPLLMAAYGGHKEIVWYLLDKGAKINQADSFGATPLHMAVLGGQKEMVELLISKGADVNVKSHNGKIPLQMAFEKDDPELIDIFLSQGLPLNDSINPYGRTLLHEAVIMGKIKAVNFLIEKGAKIDTRDNTGKTPLDLAVICGHKKVAELLVSKGAEPLKVSPLEITYIANAGFLIGVDNQKILIDALFQSGLGKYPVPPDKILQDITALKEPFAKVDLMLVTFNQAAHFDPLLTENYLVKHTETVLLAPRQVGLDLELYGQQYPTIKYRVLTITPPLKSLAEVTVKGIKLKLLRMNYINDTQNLGYIVDMGGRTFCCLGDALVKNNEEMLKKLQLVQEGIDVVLVTYWDFLNPEARAAIDIYIQPKHIVVTHIPITEKDKVAANLEKLKKQYPNLTVFKEPMEKKVF
jgi:26S proteasome non-ATPase regulatory subunit 10